jgi:hypothetical protein
MPPVQNPEDVAAAIVDVAARPRRQRYVPHYVALGVLLHWIAPTVTERLLLHALRRFHLVASVPFTHGNLFSPPAGEGSVRGGRRPVVGRAAFAAWAVADLVRMASGWLYPRSRRWPPSYGTR